MESELKGRILLVDDEVELIEELKWQLEARGYIVHTSVSGDNALDTIRKVGIDVMLVDIRMPGMNGIELMRHATKLQPDLQCIVVTGYADIDTAVAAMRIGAVNFLCKPKEVTANVFDVSIQEAMQKLKLIQKIKKEQKRLKKANEELTKANEELAEAKEKLKNLVEKRTEELKERTEELKEVNIRALLVVIMTSSVEYYEMTNQKMKIDIAEESGIWAVAQEANGPVAKTMNKYLKIDTIPQKRPNYIKVQKTANFVLSKTSANKYPELRKSLKDKLKELENFLLAS
jgi:FixJ family two-component response regulator